MKGEFRGPKRCPKGAFFEQARSKTKEEKETSKFAEETRRFAIETGNWKLFERIDEFCGKVSKFSQGRAVPDLLAKLRIINRNYALEVLFSPPPAGEATISLLPTYFPTKTFENDTRYSSISHNLRISSPPSW